MTYDRIIHPDSKRHQLGPGIQRLADGFQVFAEQFSRKSFFINRRVQQNKTRQDVIIPFSLQMDAFGSPAAQIYREHLVALSRSIVKRWQRHGRFLTSSKMECK